MKKDLMYYWMRITRGINTQRYLEFLYYSTRGRKPNLKNPKDLSEWILTKIIDGSNKKYAIYADKIRVREYIELKGVAHLLPKLLGIWQKADDIDFSNLPNRFAIKANHGCGYNIICRDKSLLNEDETRKILNKWICETYNPIENHYAEIKPLLFAEEFIENKSSNNGDFPDDCKFMCINGDPFCFLYCKERKSNGNATLYIYDMDYNFRSDWMKNPPSEGFPEKPINFEKMKEYSKLLSKDFEFVRVDLYDRVTDVLFGELTFTPASGIMTYFTDKALLEMGQKLNNN